MQCTTSTTRCAAPARNRAGAQTRRRAPHHPSLAHAAPTAAAARAQVALTYNFVDGANLACYTASLRPKLGKLLLKLLEQLGQGRRADDAAAAFAAHSAIAYYAHLLAESAGTPPVAVDAQHGGWDAFFAAQGRPGLAAEVSARAATALRALIDGTPADTVNGNATRLVALFERELNRTAPTTDGQQAHDEL
jgi:hypothetical protein